MPTLPITSPYNSDVKGNPMDKSGRENTPTIIRLRNPLTYAWLSGICLLLTLLMACGDTSSSSGGARFPAMLKACDLLTKADVETIIGGEVGEPQKKQVEPDDSGYWMSLCNYFCDEKSISVGCLIKPHGRQVTGPEAFAQYEAELNESLGTDTRMAPVDGFGDYAGWDEDSGQLTIFQGPFMVIVTSGGPNIHGSAALTLSSQVARKVLDQLPR